jgi:DNA repair protein RadD
MVLEPRYYQTEAVNAVFDYFLEHDGNPLICIPTGGGKSIIQSMIADRLIREYPKSRILFLTHQQELIKQNFDELIYNFGICDAGVYSAGIGQRDTSNQIIFAGIQSVYKKALELGCFNLIVVDESHLIPKKGTGMYLSFLANMKEIAPHCKVIGLTATPYRTDSGLLTDGKDAIFTDICYNVSVIDLIKKKYLCELIGKNGVVRPDTSGVKKRCGEFIESELSKVCDDSEIIKRAVTQIIELTEDRKHVLLFCVGIQHAEHVAEEFKRQGKECSTIHSKILKIEQEKIIKDFKNQKIKYLANCDMLTTGFNAKHIDCIVMLRPTESTGLYYQMCGRGLRVFEGKGNCLILDYAGNILRHGPIDKIEIKEKGNESERGVSTAPMKECPACGAAIALATMQCEACGYVFPTTISHDDKASDADPLHKYKAPEKYAVESVSYSLHEKNDKFSLRVTYYTGLLQSVNEWICIEHGGYAERKARQILSTMLPSGYPIPDTVEECLSLKNEFKKPTEILVDYNKKFPTIVARFFDYKEEIEEIKFAYKVQKSFIR